MAYEVVGIGNALLDFQVEVPDSALTELGVTKASMTLVDPEYQLKTFADLQERFDRNAFDVNSGGSAANTLAGLANFGASCLLIGKVADDENGKTYANDLKQIGVEMYSKPGNSLPTGTCLALITPDAERTMLTNLGISVEITEDDLNLEEIQKAKVVFLEGYMWDTPTGKAASIKGAEVGKRAGAKVAMTLSDSFCVQRHKDEFLDMVKNHVDILFANEAEAKEITGKDNIEEAFSILEKWCETVCVSTGAKGAIASRNFGKEKAEVPTWDVKLVDKLGAGDLFASGALFGILREKPIKECAYLGCFAATRVIQQMGARLKPGLSKDVDSALQGPGTNAAA